MNEVFKFDGGTKRSDGGDDALPLAMPLHDCVLLCKSPIAIICMSNLVYHVLE